MSTSLSKLNRDMPASLTQTEKVGLKEEIKRLQLKMVRIQQANYHRKERIVIVLEGFDAAGKGGVIRKLTRKLDPRGVKVIPVGPPTQEEQGTHWLSRFWKHLPVPGSITIFDRSWYGRVLVEKVEKLTDPDKLKRAYDEINQFEAQLTNDGIQVIKIFLAITKDEQLKRFHARLADPYKQWKLTSEDIKARKKWDKYVEATDTLLQRTNTPNCSWHLIAANSKTLARTNVLKVVTEQLKVQESWMEKKAATFKKGHLREMLKKSP